MNHLLSRLQKLLLSQIMIIFLVGFTFFSIQSFNYGNTMLVAQVDTVKTPEGVYYKGTPDQNQRQFRNDEQIENAQNRFQETVDNVRQKLNLDEETPEATKEFLESVQNKVEKTVEPITGTRRGYYQENVPHQDTIDRATRR